VNLPAEPQRIHFSDFNLPKDGAGQRAESSDQQKAVVRSQAFEHLDVNHDAIYNRDETYRYSCSESALMLDFRDAVDSTEMFQHLSHISKRCN
jgi:hypothetical protein